LIALDDFASELDARGERFQGRQCHRAARKALTSPPERLVQLGRINAVEPDPLTGNNDCVTVDHRGNAQQAIGAHAKLQDLSNSDRNTPNHKTIRRVDLFTRIE